MSLYNREGLGHRHASIFNRAHHPIVHETTSLSSEAHTQVINTKVPGLVVPPSVETGATPPPLIPTPSESSQSDSIPPTNAEVSPSSPVVAIPPSSSPSLSPSPSPSPLTSVSVVATPSFSPAPTPTPGSPSSDSISSTNTSSSSSKGGLSSGAIGAIVAIVVLALAALTAFIIRKLYIRHRVLKRNTWGAGLVPALQTKRNTIYGGDDEKHQISPSMQQREKTSAPVLPPMTTSFANSPNALTPPPLSYNSVPLAPASPVKNTSPSRVTPKADLAVVVRTFVPSLPDELNITNGEHVRILMAYDDGWTLCSNGRNEQGVVPLQCLQRAGTTATTTLQLQPQSEFGYGSDQSTKRLSSLVPNAKGTY